MLVMVLAELAFVDYTGIPITRSNVYRATKDSKKSHFLISVLNNGLLNLPLYVLWNFENYKAQLNLSVPSTPILR